MRYEDDDHYDDYHLPCYTFAALLWRCFQIALVVAIVAGAILALLWV